MLSIYITPKSRISAVINEIPYHVLGAKLKCSADKRIKSRNECIKVNIMEHRFLPVAVK